MALPCGNFGKHHPEFYAKARQFYTQMKNIGFFFIVQTPLALTCKQIYPPEDNVVQRTVPSTYNSVSSVLKCTEKNEEETFLVIC
jgi:hypothetical protein